MFLLPRRDMFLVLMVVLIWGAHFAVIKLGVAEVSPLVALTLRFGLTGLLFLPFVKSIDRRSFFKTVEIGILMGVFHQGLLFISIHMLDSASVAVLMQAQTLFAVILGWLLLGERFAWRTTLGLIIGIAGLMVMLGVPDIASHPQGFLICMLSALILAFSYIRMRQLPAAHPATFVAIINLVSFPLAGIGSLFYGGREAWMHLGAVNWWIMGGVLAYQALLVSISHVMWQRLLSRNEVAKVTCFTLLIPPIAIAISALFMGTQITPTLLAGTALSMAGLAVVVIRRVQKHREGPVALVE